MVYRIITPTALLLALASRTALAQDATPQRLWINAGAYSYHFDKSKSLRGNNIGLGGECWWQSGQFSITGNRLAGSGRLGMRRRLDHNAVLPSAGLVFWRRPSTRY